MIRLPMLSTDYSLTIGSRAIIALATTPNWFRSNWSLAHELAHLALGHHNGDQLPCEAEELPADEFAANPLLPEELVRQHDWQAMGEQGVRAISVGDGCVDHRGEESFGQAEDSILHRGGRGVEAVNPCCRSS